MKHYPLLLSCLLLGMTMQSCNENISEVLVDSEKTHVLFSIDEFEQDIVTRTNCDPANNYKITWASGDTIGIFPYEGDQEPFLIPADQVGTTSATFDGGYWSLKDGKTYNAYYPFSRKNFESSDMKTKIPVTYLGQSQTGISCNVGSYDYTYSDWKPSSGGMVNFSFHHLGSFMVFTLPIPATATYTSLTLNVGSDVIPTEGIYDLTAATPTFQAKKKASSLTMKLNGFNGVAGQNATFYMMVPPMDLSAETVTVSLSTGTTSCVYSIESKTILAAKLYRLTGTPKESTVSGTVDGWLPEDTTPYLTFHADATQTLTMNKAVETLEYSVNDGDWAELGTNRVTFGGSNGDLRLRGKSTYGTANSYSVFSQAIFGNNTKVYSSGDIRTLVDYEHYSEADTQNARFCKLFYGAEQLVTPPDLNSTHLATSYCYYQMFYGCKSLTKAPKLPAVGLYKNCYESMFEGCTSLIDVPDLSCLYLANECCKRMFYGCTSLEKAPALPAKNLAYSCYNSMFASCSSLVSAPELPATMLADRCYYGMFSQCTSLTKAPDLLATSSTVGDMGYSFMFSGCSNLKYVKMMALIDEEDEKEYYSLNGWMLGVAPTGTFVKNIKSTWDIVGMSGVPEGWNVIYCDENGHECVDLGTGVKWATCNIGAENPEDFGLYFAWGETEGYGQDVSDGHFFDWGSYKLCWGDENSLKKYNSSLSCGASPDNKTYLDDADDAANVNWGSNWHIPSEHAMQSLIDNCVWTWTTQNDVNGYKVSSKTNNNYIFIPAAGDRVNSSFYESNTEGNYWTTKRDFGNNCGAIGLSFNSQSRHVGPYGKRCIGLSIRPVYRE